MGSDARADGAPAFTISGSGHWLAISPSWSASLNARRLNLWPARRLSGKAGIDDSKAEDTAANRRKS
jgi:hypothetical protein